MCAIVLSSVDNCHMDGLKPALNQFWIDIQAGNKLTKTILQPLDDSTNSFENQHNVEAEHNALQCRSLPQDQPTMAPGPSCSSIALKNKFPAWLFVKVLLDLLLLLLLLKEEILLSPTYKHLCTPSSCSPFSPLLVPFYCMVSQFRSLIWQKTNSG